MVSQRAPGFCHRFRLSRFLAQLSPGATILELGCGAGFDTAEKIAEATVDALSEVQGIGLKTAERIIGTARGEQVAETAEAEAGAKSE